MVGIKEEELEPVEDVESKINRLRDELELSWKHDLEVHGVNFPTGDGKLLPLLALYESIGLPLTQDEISEWVAAHGGSYNKQARHLAGVDGWYDVRKQEIDAHGTRCHDGKRSTQTRIGIIA